METNATALIIAAAAKQAVGPAPRDVKELPRYNARLTSMVHEILDAASDHGVVGQVLQRLEQAAGFVAPELIRVNFEESSMRYIITFRRERPDEDGKMEESIRTDRVDDFRAGGYAIRLGSLAKRLIGHRVAVTLIREPMDKNPKRKVRVLLNLRDLGPVIDQED